MRRSKLAVLVTAIFTSTIGMANPATAKTCQELRAAEEAKQEQEIRKARADAVYRYFCVCADWIPEHKYQDGRVMKQHLRFNSVTSSPQPMSAEYCALRNESDGTIGPGKMFGCHYRQGPDSWVKRAFPLAIDPKELDQAANYNANPEKLYLLTVEPFASFYPAEAKK